MLTRSVFVVLVAQQVFRHLDSDFFFFLLSPDTSHCHIRSLTRRKYFKCHQLKMKLWKVIVINSWSLLRWFSRFRGKKWRIKLVKTNSDFVAADSGFIWSYWIISGPTCSDHLLLESHLIFSRDGLTAARCLFVLPFEFSKKPFICQLFVDSGSFFLLIKYFHSFYLVCCNHVS